MRKPGSGDESVGGRGRPRREKTPAEAGSREARRREARRRADRELRAHAKLLQIILYVATKLGAHATIPRVLTTMYRADCLHRKRHGRSVSAGTYYALECGVVPVEAHLVLLRWQRSSSGRDENSRTTLTMRGNRIVPQVYADLTRLSRSELACLDEAIEGEKGTADC